MIDAKKIEWVSLFANLAVFAGLIVLIFELNETNKLAQTQAMALRLDQMQQAQLWFAGSTNLPEIEIKANSDGVQSLSPTERSRYRRWHHSVMLRMKSHYYHYEQGYLDEETGQEVLLAAAGLLETWVALDLEIVDRNFREAVESAASQ